MQALNTSLQTQVSFSIPWSYTVPAPIKGAASIQKLFFGPMHYTAFDQKFVHAHIVKIDKIHFNSKILGHFKGGGLFSSNCFYI